MLSSKVNWSPVLYLISFKLVLSILDGTFLALHVTSLASLDGSLAGLGPYGAHHASNIKNFTAATGSYVGQSHRGVVFTAGVFGMGQYGAHHASNNKNFTAGTGSYVGQSHF